MWSKVVWAQLEWAQPLATFIGQQSTHIKACETLRIGIKLDRKTELRSRNTKWRECRISGGESAASGRVMLWLRQKLPHNKLSWGVKIPKLKGTCRTRIQLPSFSMHIFAIWPCWCFYTQPRNVLKLTSYQDSGTWLFWWKVSFSSPSPPPLSALTKFVSDRQIFCPPIRFN